MALDLTSKTTKEFILERTREAVKYDDVNAAREVIKIFSEELPTQQDAVATAPGLYDIYKQSWVSAQFICLSSIPEEDFFELIKEHLVEGLQLEEYDIIDKIGLRISFIELEAEQVDFMEKLYQEIKKNSGVLGSKNIKVGGRLYLPTIENWLKDYDTYPSQAAQRSDFEQITYISKSSNCSILTEDEKKVLLEVLDCYDSLRNLLSYYRSLPDAKEDFFKPENEYEFYPGAIYVDSIDEGTEAPVPPLVEQQASLDSIQKRASSPEGNPVSKTPVVIEEPHPTVPAPGPSYLVQTEEVPEVRVITPEPVPAPPVPAPRPAPAAVSMPETPRPAPDTSVADEIKNKLKEMSIKSTRPPLNVQDFLNERHHKANNSGLVFDPVQEPPQRKKIEPPKPIPSVPKDLPIADEHRVTTSTPALEKPNKAEEITKKLEELRKRKKT